MLETPTAVLDNPMVRVQLNMRLDPRSSALLAALQRKLNLTASGVIRLALVRLAELEHVEVPDVVDE
jgi:hypothetical protein